MASSSNAVIKHSFGLSSVDLSFIIIHFEPSVVRGYDVLLIKQPSQRSNLIWFQASNCDFSSNPLIDLGVTASEGVIIITAVISVASHLYFRYTGTKQSFRQQHCFSLFEYTRFYYHHLLIVTIIISDYSSALTKVRCHLQRQIGNSESNNHIQDIFEHSSCIISKGC